MKYLEDRGRTIHERFENEKWNGNSETASVKSL